MHVCCLHANVTQAACPECHAKIGGQRHVLAEGSRALEETSKMAGQHNSQPGYLTSVQTGCGCRAGISAVTNGTLRLWVHLALALGTGADSKVAAATEKALWPHKQGRAACDAPWLFAQRAGDDWEWLRTQLGLGDADLSLTLHCMLRRYREAGCAAPPSFCTQRERLAWECNFQVMCNR